MSQKTGPIRKQTVTKGFSYRKDERHIVKLFQRLARKRGTNFSKLLMELLQAEVKRARRRGELPPKKSATRRPARRGVVAPQPTPVVSVPPEEPPQQPEQAPPSEPNRTP